MAATGSSSGVSKADMGIKKSAHDSVSPVVSNETSGNAAGPLSGGLESFEQQFIRRKLTPRQIHLATFAGAVGAGLFVAIGKGVLNGPAALFSAFCFWSSIVFCIAECHKEMTTLLPLDAAFIRLAGRFIDPSWGVAVGWCQFLAQICSIMFESTMVNTLCQYWGWDKNPAILITVVLLLFLCLNIYRGDIFGEAEFWLALVKVTLGVGLMVFTFIVMVGGNPHHDRFGFRYWRDPGAWAGCNGVERLESFVNGLITAGFSLSGPEWISMIAGEAKNPRSTIPRSYNNVIWRLLLFGVGGSFAVGILVPMNDPTLTNGSHTYAGASPYVIAMKHLGIPVLPDIVNACFLFVVISAGNTYVFNASRSLHALALEGTAPKVLRRCNKHGVPYVAVTVTMLLSCLAYLNVSEGTAKVINWLLNFNSAGVCVFYVTMSLTYIRFDAALKAQGIDKKTFLPVCSKFTPWAGYYAFFWAFMFMWIQGYAVFLKGNWEASQFVFNYGIIMFGVAVFLIWKVAKRTHFYRAREIDLISDVQFFNALTEHYKQAHDDGQDSMTLKGKILKILC